MDDSIDIFESILHRAKFGRNVSGKLGLVRFVHESDMQTLERIIEAAQKITCPECRGYRRTFVGICRHCDGTGERAYNPKEINNG